MLNPPQLLDYMVNLARILSLFHRKYMETFLFEFTEKVTGFKMSTLVFLLPQMV